MESTLVAAGAFAKASGLVDKDVLFAEIEKAFGAVNRTAAERAYRETVVANR